jgi:hypothetical protein
MRPMLMMDCAEHVVVGILVNDYGANNFGEGLLTAERYNNNDIVEFLTGLINAP